MWRSFIVFLAKTHTLNSTYISFMFVPKLVSANVCWEEVIFERLLIATSGFVDWPVFQRLNNHPWVRYLKCFLTTPRWLHWRRKWQPTPVFLPGKPHGPRSLAGYSPWRSQRVGHNWSDLQSTHNLYWLALPILSYICSSRLNYSGENGHSCLGPLVEMPQGFFQ